MYQLVAQYWPQDSRLFPAIFHFNFAPFMSSIVHHSFGHLFSLSKEKNG